MLSFSLRRNEKRFGIFILILFQIQAEADDIPRNQCAAHLRFYESFRNRQLLGRAAESQPSRDDSQLPAAAKTHRRWLVKFPAQGKCGTDLLTRFDSRP
jgi:hypothetical protein